MTMREHKTEGSPADSGNGTFSRPDVAPEIMNMIRSHFDKQLSEGLSCRSPAAQHMWMSSLDTRTGRYPEDDRRPPEIPRRHYRAIDAPKGCSLYWDMPALTAAHALSATVGDRRYADAANAYIDDFMNCCIAGNGVFLWGNHYYWDAFSGEVKKFCGEEAPQPIVRATETGNMHEVRPLPVSWELLWQRSKEKTEREIRMFTALSVYDSESGGFNRHADKHPGCAFLESGGIAAEALSWLFGKTGDETLLQQARKIIDFSFSHRNMNTGLTVNNPGTDRRWDSFTSTTECGLWAGRVLQAELNTGGRLGRTEQALSVLRSYLKYGYDHEKKRYYGRLNIADGAPILGTTAGDNKTLAKHQPGDYADWKHSFFPIHDYPLQFAEACLAAYRISGETEFKEGAMRWAESLIASRAEPSPATGIYAEHYGRCSHFLNSCGRQLSIPRYEKESCSLLKEAAGVLFDCGMFRTHPGEHRYDAVDGLGFLILSMIAQETGKEPDMMGASW